MSTRALDILVWGATGFTGRLVAEYLLRRYGAAPGSAGEATFRWGIGGRSEAKLRALRDELAAIDARAAALPLVVGDALERADMERVAAEARVVATTAGPFAHHGRELIGACARAGTHYCDLTGETTFVREAIDRHHDAAAKSGARIVPCSGFDSIPSDLGVSLLHEAFVARGSALRTAKMFVMHSSGGVSGGTVASMLLLMEQATGDPAVRKLLADPYALDPRDAPRGPEEGDALAPRYDADLGAWVGPFVMAAINTRIVRRSNALLDHPYGKDFRYSETMRTGRGVKGRLAAGALSAGIVAGMSALAFGPARKLLARTLLPKPGEGPSKEQRERGSFTLRFFGADARGETAWATVAGTSDPGYGETAKMLSESALGLALDAAKLPARAGVLTPASALGRVLVDRLRAAGMTFSAA